MQNRSMNPSLKKQLSETELQYIHSCALDLLKNIGIEIQDSLLRARFSNQDGITIRGERLYFEPTLIDHLVEEHRHQVSKPDSLLSRLRLLPYDYASYIVDLETDEIRPITETDLIDMTKLIDSLSCAGYPISGGCPGFAQDLPEPLRAVAQYKIGAEYSRTGRFADVPTIPAAEAIWRMSQVMGDTSFGMTLFMFNPLRVDEASLERILHFLDQDVPLSLSVSSMPLLGASTPIDLTACMAQSAAEILAGFTMLKLIAGKNPVDLRIQLFAFDMKNSNVALGAAEGALLSILAKELTDFYGGITHPNPYIFSTGKLPGEQAAAEKMAHALYKALAGARTLSCGGATATTIFSPEQLLYDCEIISYVDRILRGFTIGDAAQGLEAIRECYQDGLYLAHETTVQSYRNSYWNPRFFEHISYKAWDNTGRTSQRQRIKDTVRDMIRKHSFTLDESKRQQLEKIYAEARANLA